MVIPAPMNYYTGAELLKRMDPKWREIQRRELTTIGDARAREYGATGLSEDFVVGVELGLATARALLAGSPEVILKGGDPKKIL